MKVIQRDEIQSWVKVTGTGNSRFIYFYLGGYG